MKVKTDCGKTPSGSSACEQVGSGKRTPDIWQTGNTLLLLGLATGVGLCPLVTCAVDAEAQVTSITDLPRSVGEYSPGKYRSHTSFKAAYLSYYSKVQHSCLVKMLWKSEFDLNGYVSSYKDRMSFNGTAYKLPDVAASAPVSAGAGWNFRYNVIPEETGTRQTYVPVRISFDSLGGIRYGWLRYDYTETYGAPLYTLSEGYFQKTSDKVIYTGQKVDSPSTNASEVTVTTSTSTATINWTSGNGAGRLVVARQAEAVNQAPAINTTYSADAAFGSGDDLGDGNYVVYNGTGHAVVVTGLTPETTYHFQIVEYNGTSGSEFYYLSKFGGAPAETQATTNPVQPVCPGAIVPVNQLILSRGQIDHVGQGGQAEPEADTHEKRTAEGNLGLLAYGARGVQTMRNVRARTGYFPGHVLVRDASADDQSAWAERLAHAERMVRQTPESADAHLLLGVVRQEAGRLDAAADSAHAALGLNPEHVDAHLLLARLLSMQGRKEEALVHAEAAHASGPSAATSLRLGLICKDLNRNGQALGHLREAMRLCPDGVEGETARYFLASIDDQPVPDGTREGYVRRLFDGYAGRYDNHMLGVLGYKGPALVQQTLSRLLPQDAPGDGEPMDSTQPDVLDLGCGTGLCGRVLRPLAGRLAGVDLSSRMLDRARVLGVYDSLEQGDIVQHLERSTATHDVVAAADVLVYMGELDRLLTAVHSRLTPEGLFVFTVERSSAAPVRLGSSGRYAHSEDYLRGAAAGAGFEVASLTRTSLRSEGGEPVSGFVVGLRAV